METSEKKPKKRFSRKQLRASQGLLTMQARTNIYSSQSGMTCFGAVRHARDIKADNFCIEGQGELTQTSKTNIYASQKGMNCFGSVRHGPDIRADDASSEGLSTLTLQTGTNIYASQAGMRGFGAVRHGSDIKVIELYDEGNDDEYPTDEDEPSPMKPARKFREEAHDADEQMQQNGDVKVNPEVKPEVQPEIKSEPVVTHEKSPSPEDTTETNEVEEYNDTDEQAMGENNDEVLEDIKEENAEFDMEGTENED